jgi:hypothetical protein
MGLDADLVRHRQRFWCRHMARRTRLDPDGIDLCWLMLAADPANPAVTYGFVDRLGDRFVAWVQQSDNVIPDSIVLNRLDRWSQIRDGEPAKAGDPFAAVTDAVWLQAEDKKVGKDEDGRSDGWNPPEVKRAVQNARKRAADGLPSLQVIDPAAKLNAPPYKAVAAAKAALTVCPEVRPVAAALRVVQGRSPLDAWRRTILGDAPHVLIFPEIGMDKVSAQLAAQRLAAVQCCSWGHPVTSGFPTIDYFISSEFMEPVGAVNHYSEQLIRLPNLSIYYEPTDLPSIGVDRAQLGLRSSAVVYWCCQSLPKYLPQFDDVFARIAADVPDSQFTFIEFGGGRGITEMFRFRLERAFRKVELDATEHCVFLPRLAPDRFVAAIGQCDVVLDSIGWSGCNSILESLVHNVPIVTLAGELMRGRHTAAILDMMDVRKTTARTIDEYVSIAGLLGRDMGKRSEVAAKIAANKQRVYRDRECITALEDFLDEATRNGFPKKLGDVTIT